MIHHTSEISQEIARLVEHEQAVILGTVELIGRERQIWTLTPLIGRLGYGMYDVQRRIGGMVGHSLLKNPIARDIPGTNPYVVNPDNELAVNMAKWSSYPLPGGEIAREELSEVVDAWIAAEQGRNRLHEILFRYVPGSRE